MLLSSSGLLRSWYTSRLKGYRTWYLFYTTIFLQTQTLSKKQPGYFFFALPDFPRPPPLPPWDRVVDGPAPDGPAPVAKRVRVSIVCIGGAMPRRALWGGDFTSATPASPPPTAVAVAVVAPPARLPRGLQLDRRNLHNLLCPCCCSGMRNSGPGGESFLSVAWAQGGQQELLEHAEFPDGRGEEEGEEAELEGLWWDHFIFYFSTLIA